MLTNKGGHIISGERVKLKTLEADPHKFLGCVMTFNNSPEDHLKFLKEKLNNKLVNIDKPKVRAEYKMARGSPCRPSDTT